MGDEPESDRLEASWRANAEPWTQAVRSGAIASRRLVTDDAVVKAVLATEPKRVLDLGCGEGWLCRALAPHVETVVGVDASPDLVFRAMRRGGAAFGCLSFAEIVADPERVGSPFDTAVLNFALLDREIEPLLQVLRRSVVKLSGGLVIQTLHPMSAGPPYVDGWREENFAGFETGASWQPMPWYFRTFTSWLDLVARLWMIVRLEEPLNPETQMPASLLMTCQAWRKEYDDL